VKRHKKTSHKELSEGTIDYSAHPACIAVLPEGDLRYSLSRGARRQLSRLEQEGTSDRNVGPLFDGEELSERVRVVEIIDERNPAKLLALPGQISYGVVANRNFKTDDAVLCYGGYLMDNEKYIDDFDSYLFNVNLSEFDYTYTGPTLFISGKNSVAGKINDPWSLGDTMKRTANLKAWIHFDPNARTPQIVLYAMRDIEKGEELLYDYGVSYWKKMWRSLMMDHALYTAKTGLYCDALKKAISDNRCSP
jgi:hypothetical protein